MARGTECGGYLKSVTAKTNIVADIIVGQVNCLQFSVSRAKSFMPNIIVNDKQSGQKRKSKSEKLIGNFITLIMQWNENS